MRAGFPRMARRENSLAGSVVFVTDGRCGDNWIGIPGATGFWRDPDRLGEHPMTPAIHTPRLNLIAMTPAFLEACLSDNSSEAERLLGVPLDPELYGRKDLLGRRLQQIQGEPDYQPWNLRAIVLRETNEMVGRIGFHTRPNPDYLAELAPNAVEFGYEIYTPFRRRGYAEEACRGMMAWASQQPGVERFVLSISPENAPSLKLAEKLGFTRIGEWMDEEDGLEWVFAREVQER